MTSRLNLWTIAIFCSVVVATVGWIGVSGTKFGDPPGDMGDDVYFENIAFHLALNQGVKFDFTNPDWRLPYAEANDHHQNDWILALQHSGQTTSRAPGFPHLVSWIYRIFGRNFEVVRVVNVLLLAGAMALLLRTTIQYFGYLVGAFASFTILLDFFVLRTAGQFMTEATGTALICLLFVACVQASRPQVSTHRYAWAAWLAIGLLFGAATLVRANLNAWFLLIVAALGCRAAWSQVRGRSGWHEFRVSLAFVAGVVVIASPWWIRNCQVTGGFSPFGTSGSFGLVGGYCDEAFSDFGNWSIQASVDSQMDTVREPGFNDLSLAQQEYLMGKRSTNRSLKWMAENGTRVPQLMGMKMISHLGFYRQPWWIVVVNGLMCFGALIGIYASRKSFGFWITAVLMLSLITTSLTWPHYGRYSIPIRPLIHVASAIGTVFFWTTLLTWLGLLQPARRLDKIRQRT